MNTKNTIAQFPESFLYGWRFVFLFFCSLFLLAHFDCKLSHTHIHIHTHTHTHTHILGYERFGIKWFCFRCFGPDDCVCMCVCMYSLCMCVSDPSPICICSTVSSERRYAQNPVLSLLYCLPHNNTDFNRIWPLQSTYAIADFCPEYGFSVGRPSVCMCVFVRISSHMLFGPLRAHVVRFAMCAPCKHPHSHWMCGQIFGCGCKLRVLILNAFNYLFIIPNVYGADCERWCLFWAMGLYQGLSVLHMVQANRMYTTIL